MYAAVYRTVDRLVAVVTIVSVVALLLVASYVERGQNAVRAHLVRRDAWPHTRSAVWLRQALAALHQLRLGESRLDLGRAPAPDSAHRVVRISPVDEIDEYAEWAERMR